MEKRCSCERLNSFIVFGFKEKTNKYEYYGPFSELSEAIDFKNKIINPTPFLVQKILRPEYNKQEK